MAKNNLGWDIFDENKNYNKIKIDIKKYLNNIYSYEKKITNCLNYLNINRFLCNVVLFTLVLVYCLVFFKLFYC